MATERPNPDAPEQSGETLAPETPSTPHSPTSISEAPIQSPASEKREIVPTLELTTAGPCKNPKGRYVGLSQGQRERIRVQIGETVELFNKEGTSLGVFTVGPGSREILLTPAIFTANDIERGTIVKVRARKTPPEGDHEFAVLHLVEKEDPEKHQRRQDIITNRLKLDPDVYVTIPTSLAAHLGIKPPAGQTIAPISKGILKGVDGTEHEIAIVPTGSAVGFTSKAAKQLGIPPQLGTIRLKVDDGKLVIN